MEGVTYAVRPPGPLSKDCVGAGKIACNDWILTVAAAGDFAHPTHLRQGQVEGDGASVPAIKFFVDFPLDEEQMQSPAVRGRPIALRASSKIRRIVRAQRP